MKLTWSRRAQADRERIYEYIDIDSPQAALLVDDRNWNSIIKLKDYPERGRPGRVAETRELVVQRIPYIIAYRIDPDRIRILRIVHGGQRWPANLAQE